MNQKSRAFVKNIGVEIFGSGFWETAIGEATTTELVYMLAFEDLGHYQRAWDAFIADPEWQAAKRLTEVGGPLVNVASSKILES